MKILTLINDQVILQSQILIQKLQGQVCLNGMTNILLKLRRDGLIIHLQIMVLRLLVKIVMIFQCMQLFLPEKIQTTNQF